MRIKILSKPTSDTSPAGTYPLLMAESIKQHDFSNANTIGSATVAGNLWRIKGNIWTWGSIRHPESKYTFRII